MKRVSLLLLAALSSSPLRAADRFDDLPLMSREEREQLTPEILKSYSQEALNKLYAQLSSGSLPDGEYEGTVIFDDSESNELERILAILSPYGISENLIKEIGTWLWRGKIFNRKEARLSNRVGLVRRFPAHVFCGQSLLDSRRESIVLDYNYADDLPGYLPVLDWPVTRQGLGIRDELRMIRPGLYLGRAYIKSTFALNFVLEQSVQESEKAWLDACKS